MTEFEEQIAGFFKQGVRHLLSCAVRNPSPGGDYLAVCNCGRDDALALRVAAAIEAARWPVPVHERQRIIDLDQAAGSTYEVWFTAGDDPRHFDYEGEAYKHADELQRNAALAALRGERA